jgi:hypothetical protein
MKKIEVAPEWFLTELPHMHVADGKGNMSFFTDSVTDVRWIRLALSTLGIKVREYDKGDDHTVSFGFDVKIDDIKADCPELYLEWNQLDEDVRYDRTVEGAFKRFLDDNSATFKPETVGRYNALKKHLEVFFKSNGQAVYLVRMRMNFEPDFRTYLFSRGLNKNAVKIYIKAKRVFLNWCLEKHYFIRHYNKKTA